MSVNKMWMNKCVQSTKFYTVVKMKELEIHMSLCVHLKNSVEQKHQVVGYINKAWCCLYSLKKQK